MCAFLAFSFVLNAQALISQIQKQIEPGVRADDSASFYNDYVTCFFLREVFNILFIQGEFTGRTTEENRGYM
uniref:Putative secreted protein n=1 Tax=Ixodes ricinus TaxID=34613 RepID=A0A6B0TUB0_IXORI